MRLHIGLLMTIVVTVLGQLVSGKHLAHFSAPSTSGDVSKTTGPVFTIVKTDPNANFKWGVRHYVGRKYHYVLARKGLPLTKNNPTRTMLVPASAVATVVCALLLTVSPAVLAQHQQQIDPSYLQQYYAQVAQAAGAQADATPIVEQTPAADAQQQYYVSPQAQQIRVKDAVAQQVRAQQQQQYVAPSVRQYLQQPQPKPQQPQHVQYLQQPQQQQQIHYRPAPAPAPKQTLAVAAPRPRPQQYQQQPQEEDQRLNKEDEEEYEQNPSYQFGFDVKDDEFTNYQNRKESRDGNVIKGSYSVVDSDGFIRTVTYTADPKEGFKAQVVREPTDIVVKVPTPAPQTSQIGLRAAHPQQQQQHQQHQPQQQQYYQPQQQQQQQSPLPYRAPQKQHQQQVAQQPHYQYE